MKKLLLLPLLITTACATNAQRQMAIMSNGIAAASKQIENCNQGVYEQEKYKDIISYLPLPSGIYQPSLSVLNNKSRPTSKQSELLISYHDDMLPCRQEGINKISLFAPSFVPIIMAFSQEYDSAFMALANRKISWGTFAKKAQQLQSNYLMAINQESQHINSALDQQHQAELQQRQSASNALMQYGLAQQQIQAQQYQNSLNNRIRMNCTTQTTGIWTNTDCY